MVRQAIEQATCESCDDDDAEFTVSDSRIIRSHDAIAYDVRCSCRATGIIAVDANGTHAGRGINHDSASWN